MTKIIESSGDVFSDIGFAPTEALNLRLRSELMIQLRELIAHHGLTQNEAAELFGVDQPRVSDMVRGKIHRFTIDALVTMLAKAGVATRVVAERRHTSESFYALHDVDRRCVETWSEFGLVNAHGYGLNTAHAAPLEDSSETAYADSEYALCA